MKSLFGHVVLLAAAACIILSLHKNGLFIPYDGAYRTEMIKENFEWSRFTINSSINPLQALGGQTFPFNFWMSPACLINELIYKNDVSPVLIYTIISIELFLAVYWLARCLQASFFCRYLAAWLSVIFIMPFILPANSGGLFSFYAISSIIPDAVEGISIVSFILGLIICLDLARFREAIVRCLVLALLVIYLIIQFPIHCILSLPLVGLFSFYWLVVQVSNRRDLLRMAACLAAVFVPAIPPLLFAAGWFLDCPAALFPHDFNLDRPTWTFISILFHGVCNVGWMGPIVFLLAFAGSAFALFRRRGHLRTAAPFYILYSSFLVLAGIFFSFVYTKYRVPSALYYEWYLWPLMFIYTSSLLEAGLRRLAALISLPPSFVTFIATAKDRWTPVCSTFSLGCVAGLISTGAAILAFQYASRSPAPLVYPPPKTGLLEELAAEVALSPGKPWKGCVATITDSRPPAQNAAASSWPDQCAWDSEIWTKTGSEYRSICPWWWNIPTLFANSSTISPDYYYLMTRLFAVPADAQIRSVLVLTHPHVNLLRLFGTRILITNTMLAPDSQLRPLPALTDAPDLFVYELGNPNLAGFSPAQLIRCSTAEQTLAQLQRNDLDPFKQAVVFEDLPGKLTPATAPQFIWKKNVVSVQATAPGLSLLVLPFQYSHCIKLKSLIKTGVQPRAIRVDLALTGILFSKTLDIVLTPRYGPFLNVLGRINDVTELKRLDLH